MRMRISQLTLFVFLILLISFSGAQAAKMKIAVLPFEDGSLKHWWSGDFRPGEGIADSMVTALVNSKAFVVVERSELKKVLEEQGLGGTGIVDPATAAKVGKVLGVRYLVMGKVTDFSLRESNVGVGSILSLFGSNNQQANTLDSKTGTARVAIDARLIDTETAEIAFAEKGVGEMSASNIGLSGQNIGMTNFKESILGKATEKAIETLVQKVVESAKASPEGKVVDVEGSIITINMGEGEVTVGQELKIFSKGKEIKDPDTGELLECQTDEIGLIRVISVSKKVSKCSVLETTRDIKPRDVVKFK
ncbi:MAG: CsgG/HfaB family protein [bacterium]